MPNKILIIGRLAAGKTSIKRAVFEGKNPENLLRNPLPPTKGIETTNYKWLDLDLGVFDTSGQEFMRLLLDEEERIKAFASCNVIIYVLAYPDWKNLISVMGSEIRKVRAFSKKYSDNARFCIFLHKIDMIPNLDENKAKELIRDVEKKLGLDKDIDVFATSLTPDYIYNIFNAFFDITSKLSTEVQKMVPRLEKDLKGYTKTLCLCMNHNNSITLQVKTPDFNPEIISILYKNIANAFLMSDSIVVIGAEIANENGQIFIRNIYKDASKGKLKQFKNILIISEHLDEKEFNTLSSIIYKRVSKELSNMND